MAKSTFVYVIYIASRPETVWKLLDGEFTRQYRGTKTSRTGNPARRGSTGATAARSFCSSAGGQPPRRLVISWAEPQDRTRRTATPA
jgi:uncharacterized protein YndB with AHSA1/START domain